MVGKRGLAFEQQDSASTPLDNNEEGHDWPRRRNKNKNRNGVDLEAGAARASSSAGGPARGRPRLWKFKDAAVTALDDKRRDELKRELLEGVDRTGLEKYRRSEAELDAIKSKPVRAFYEAQNDRLDDWLEVDAIVMSIADDVLESMDPDPDRDGEMERQGGIQEVQGRIGELLPDEVREKRAKAAKHARWAINTNVLANILLLLGKGVAASSTGSLSLIASLADSALDLLCTIIIWSTNKLVAWRLNSLQRRFPVGRKRLEPLGIVVFSIIMVISFLEILKESIEELAPLRGEAKELSITAISALLATIVLKGLIGLACMRIPGTQVQALVQDCKTDVIFNTLSLLFPFVGAKTNVWWLDPAGAAILSVFIIFDWGHTCFENIIRLSGEAAPPHIEKKLMYLAWRFSPVVKGIKKITAYHCGDGIWAEFDILLDEKTSLHRSHDVAETLQYCAEGLNEVDRAFVTTDYSSSGPTGHAEE